MKATSLASASQSFPPPNPCQNSYFHRVAPARRTSTPLPEPRGTIPAHATRKRCRPPFHGALDVVILAGNAGKKALRASKKARCASKKSLRANKKASCAGKKALRANKKSICASKKGLRANKKARSASKKALRASIFCSISAKYCSHGGTEARRSVFKESKTFGNAGMNKEIGK